MDNLTNGRRYELEVRAVNDAGGGDSSLVSAVPSELALQPEAAVTAAPRGLQVSWTPPPTTASILDRYVVHWEPEAGQLYTASPKQRDVTATQTSLTVSDLVAGVRHRVRVEAHFDDGTIGSSPDVAAAPTRLQQPLAAPGNVSLTVDPNDRYLAKTSPPSPIHLVVAFEPPEEGSQSPVLFYEAQWKHGDADSYQPLDRARIDVGPSSLDEFSRSETYSLSETYRLRLRSWNLDGPGDWHSTAGQTVLVAFAPDPPGLDPPEPDGEQLVLSWSPPAFAGGSPISRYTVQYQPDGGDRWQDHPHNKAATTTVISNLENGRSYDVRVAATNGAGTSKWSNTATATPYTAPGEPRELALTPDDGRITATWQAPADDGGAPIQHYRVRYRADNDTEYTDGPVVGVGNVPPGQDYKATISDLENGTAYTVQVAAHNVGGTGSPADDEATPYTIPGEPTELALTPDDGRITATWKAPADNGGAPIQHYKVRYITDAGTEYTDGPVVRVGRVPPPGHVYEATISDLENDVAYTVQVAAHNAGGPGSPATATATPLTERSQVRQKIVSVITEHEAEFPWLRAALKHLDARYVDLLFLSDHRIGEALLECDNTYLSSLPRCMVLSYSVEREPSDSTVIHELAHVYTHVNYVENDPGTIALAWLYLVNTYGAVPSGRCDTAEIVADALEYTVKRAPGSITYWNLCRTVPLAPSDVEVAVFEAAVSGAVPDWFIDTYGGDKDNRLQVWTEAFTGDPARVWADVRKLPKDPRGVVVTMLRNFFGGYCSVGIAWLAAFNDSGRDNPWAHGGCKPEPPTEVAIRRGATSLTMAWTPRTSPKGGAITEYIVQWRSTDSSDNEGYPSDNADFGPTNRQVEIPSSGAPSYEMTGLSANKTYAVRVRAVNATDPSDWVEQRGTVAVATPPADFGITSAAGALAVSWNPPADNGGSAVTGYILQWKADGVVGQDDYSDTERRVVITDPAIRSHTIGSLTDGRQYTVRVRATTTLGEGENAEASDTAGRPPALHDVRVDPGACANFSCTVLWGLPSGGGGAAPITGYGIEWKTGFCDYGDASCSSGSVSIADGSAISQVVSIGSTGVIGLRIRPLSGTVPGPWTEISFRPNAATMVRNLDFSYDPNTAQFTVTWDAPRFSGGTLAGYRVSIEECRSRVQQHFLQRAASTAGRPSARRSGPTPSRRLRSRD